MLVQEGKFDLWLVNFKSWNFFDGSSLGRYIDSKGKARFVGTSGLSQSQTFGCIISIRHDIDLKKSWRNKLSNHMISPSTCSMPLSRTYPRGFASQLLKSYEQHLGSGEGRRDLRFKPQVNPRLSELQQFKELQLGDAWEDAHMVELLDYLMTSKKVRTASISWDIVCKSITPFSTLRKCSVWLWLGFPKSGMMWCTPSMMTTDLLFLSYLYRTIFKESFVSVKHSGDGGYHVARRAHEAPVWRVNCL